MLRINLLPQEFRQSERKPLGSYVMIAFCTILAVSSMCVAAYLYFGFLKEAETARDIAKEQYDNLAPMAKYADDLEREKLEYMKRSDVIKEIETTRILWTKKLDQLMAVVNNNGDIDRHWVWLKELKIAMGGSRVNGMNVKGFTVGDQYEQLSNFNEHLKQHELYHNDFISISNPTGSIVYDKKMNPTTAIEFAWDMQLSDKRVK